MITEIMITETLQPAEVVDLFEDLANNCRKDGVSFGELLAEPMYVGDVTPLAYEILRCDYKALDLVWYLLNATSSRKVGWIVRTACQQRGEDGLFQLLRGETDGTYWVTIDE